MTGARAIEVRKVSNWSGTPADVVELEFDDRHRRRIRLQGRDGLSFLLDLPKAAILEHGDALLLNDGRLVAVAAAAERVMDARAGSPRELARLAWHVGNRHLPAEIHADRIRLRYDHVIAAMLRGLGAAVDELDGPFAPEPGAYAGHGGSHSHGHHGHGEAAHAH
ncbi:urease accessory protein UreE [Pacificimonas flava]|uniref:Urease accessory protein UreE n=2 Tax=Pacificimonas TaxID=1960290 RepID=A0A219B0W6_9SPHN|nr:urease accessory protein UreE [Pacificimonas aurantium]OWV31971.1 urease accessory protein UreE [Pacificimonas flava]